MQNTRDAAYQLGEARYNTGEPCKKRGHLADRYTSNGGCVDCLNLKIAKHEKPARNQFWLTSMAYVPPNTRPTKALEKFFSIKLQQSCPHWYAEYVEKQMAGAVILGAIKADPLGLDQLVATEKAGVFPLSGFVEKGWTPAQLVKEGYATVYGVTNGHATVHAVATTRSV